MATTVLEKLKSVEAALLDITDSWHTEARMILCHVLNCQPIDLVLDPSKPIYDNDHRLIDSIVQKRLSRMPLQYCIGHQEFYGLTFEVDEHVLIPRPETEILVAFVHQTFANKAGNLLDIGVGSGAIVVTLAQKLDRFKCYGLDISKEALGVAMRNAVHHQVDERITFLHSNLFEALSGDAFGDFFDVIVSNPPYIPLEDQKGLEPEVVCHEPALALFGGVDGLDFYRTIIPEARNYLKEHGLLVFEAGHDQCEAIETLFRRHGYKDVGHFTDYHGIPRFIYGKKAPIGG